jgi:RimJ/RimL family protein N-acetyltransferase
MNLPMLFTPRLTLRPLSGADFEAWAAFSADPATMRFIGGVKSRAESWRTLCTAAGAWSVRGFSVFSVIERDTGRWVGRIGPWEPEGWPMPEIAWAVAPEFAGTGYAHEAAIAAIDYAVDVLGWDQIVHTIAPDNVRSIRLAQRLGAVNRGPVPLPEPFTDLRVDAWGQSAATWRSTRAARYAASTSAG